MNTKEKVSLHASTLQITLRVILILFFAALLTFAAMPAGNQFKQKPTRAVPECAAPCSSVKVLGYCKTENSAQIGARGIFRKPSTCRQSRNRRVQCAPARGEESLTPPVGLQPVEQEAWLAMARRQGASGGTELASFYPNHYGEPFESSGDGASKSDGYGDIYANSYCYCNRHGHIYADADSNSYSHTHGDSYGHIYTHTDSNGYSHTNGDRHSHIYAYTDCNSYSHTHGNSNSDIYSDSYRYCYGHIHADTDCNSYPHADGDSNSHLHA